MLKRSDELNRDVINNLMEGEGAVNRTHLLEGEDLHEHGRLYAKHLLEPGHSIGFHKHEGEQEAYIILKGRASYNDNGNLVEIGEGDFTLCRSGEGHSIKNIGKDNLEFIGLIMNT